MRIAFSIVCLDGHHEDCEDCECRCHKEMGF